MAAKSLNSVQLIGNLGKDPEVKFTPNGVAVATFSIATNEGFKDKNGQWQDRTEWHNIVAWQRLAEIVGEYAKKGSKVFIQGKLKTDSWEDKQSGKRIYRTNIVAQDLILLGGRQDGESRGDGRDRGFDQPTSRGWEGTAVTADDPITDADVPF